MCAAFKDIAKIKFEGPKSKNPLAFKYYNPDELVEGKVQAVVVDRECLDAYHHRKPGRFGKLKELAKSEIFPDSAVVYRPGVFGAALLDRFREGLEKADRTAIGRQLLVLWTMTGLQKPPADYNKILANIVKAYPPPWEAKSKDRLGERGVLTPRYRGHN